MANIELLNVSKRFGAVSVIEDLSLEIRSQEFVVFLGPSGCGKSTLLRMIAGLETTDAGEIRIGGERVDALPPGQRQVAMVFQNYALYPHMTVHGNMAFGLSNVGMKREEIERRIADAAKILEISNLLDRRPAQLSGGQRQRVAIGRAIVKDPKAFLFDEPLSNLDAALRVRTRLELAELRNRMKSTMIYVTHDQVEAMTLADRIVVLNERRIEQIGTPMEIYGRPATKFVAAFVGSPAMNFSAVSIGPVGNGATSLRLPDGSTLTATLDNGLLKAGADGYELGIRADHVSICKPGEGTTTAGVQVVERLGERTLVYTTLADGSPIVASDSGLSTVRPGETVGLRFDGAGVHLFDRAGKAYHAG
jgi:multiple sugar transport system ATP-binding protein